MPAPAQCCDHSAAGYRPSHLPAPPGRWACKVRPGSLLIRYRVIMIAFCRCVKFTPTDQVCAPASNGLKIISNTFSMFLKACFM